jgi:hypothetical protein
MDESRLRPRPTLLEKSDKSYSGDARELDLVAFVPFHQSCHTMIELIAEAIDQIQMS